MCVRILVILLLALTPAFAENPQPTTVELITNRSSVPAGGSLLAGVLFKIQPSWHIYWKEPGDSGLPTRIKFSLPEGSTAGELLWPLHEKFVLPGDIKGNGYSNEVLLWAPLSISTEAEAPFKIDAEVTWLNCSNDVCLREKRKLSKEVGIGAEQPSPEAPLFAEWEKKLPSVE